jgi:hypothetical protein
VGLATPMHIACLRDPAGDKPRAPHRMPAVVVPSRGLIEGGPIETVNQNLLLSLLDEREPEYSSDPPRERHKLTLGSSLRNFGDLDYRMKSDPSVFAPLRLYKSPPGTAPLAHPRTNCTICASR